MTHDKIPADHLVRCKKQTSDLFDIFLLLDANSDENLPKSKTMEYKEVYSLERDSARAPSLKGSNDSPLLSRSPGIDVHNYADIHAEKEKRRSIELTKRFSYGSTPPKGQYMPNSQVDRILAQTPPLATSPLSSSASLTKSSSSSSIQRDASLERDEVHKRSLIRPESAPKPEYEEFPSEQEQRRSRTYSVGPTEEQIKEAALEIAHVGDKIEEEYGKKLKLIEKELTEFVRRAGTALTYEVFAAHVNDLVEHDRNWRNFMFVMYLGKRVVKTTQSVGVATADYFRRFVGDAFAEQIARQHDVVTYVRSNSTSHAEES